MEGTRFLCWLRSLGWWGCSRAYVNPEPDSLSVRPSWCCFYSVYARVSSLVYHLLLVFPTKQRQFRNPAP